jgi:hypothetical protein
MRTAVLFALVLAVAGTAEAGSLGDDCERWLRYYDAPASSAEKISVIAWISGAATMLGMVTPGCDSSGTSVGTFASATADLLRDQTDLAPTPAVLITFARLHPSCLPALNAALGIRR